MSTTKYVVGAIAGVIVGAVGLAQLWRADYPEPEFEIIEHAGAFEVRRYAARVVAETNSRGETDWEAHRQGFKRLACFIFGGNKAGEELEMTAPVEAFRRSPEEWVIRFTLPYQRALPEYPTPEDKSVQLRALPAQDLASLEFHGSYSPALWREHAERLQSSLEDGSWQPAGEPVVAMYDPPWVLGFLRRNEVHIPVTRRDE